ncbi:hypothetical protein Zmor_022503 [Zophobas morio]|uniref:Uncharacterized protein n=1 Tax=Zophobas morio TaxID=2755281 RepID=A0AA38HVD7_9CUCU|nr:hypothetical protein Zmor_022503 [Zophobas morio]
MYLKTVAVLFLCVLQLIITCDFRFNYVTKIAGKFQDNKHQDAKEITVTSPEISGVTIKDEHIPTLCCKIFNLKYDMRFIVFDNCGIEQIQEECFSEKVENITTQIAIINDKLTSIKTGTFRNLKVRIIHLENNLIEVIEEESFLNLPNLMNLDLSFNNLHILNSKAFVNLPHFGSLILESNRIKALHNNSLYFFRSVYSVLDIKCNNLTYIDKNALDGMAAENFDSNLYGNKLVSLPEGVFDHHRFSSIHVGKNPLRNLSKHFCSQNCTVQEFHFGCGGLNMESIRESVQNIENWVRANKVILYTDDDCSFNISEKITADEWPTCKSTGSTEEIWIWNYLQILVILYFTMCSMQLRCSGNENFYLF